MNPKEKHQELKRLKVLQLANYIRSLFTNTEEQVTDCLNEKIRLDYEYGKTKAIIPFKKGSVRFEEGLAIVGQGGDEYIIKNKR